MQNPYFVNPALFLQGFGDTLNSMEGIKKAKMYNKYAPKEEEAKLADMIARQQNDQAMAKYAPELYGSRAGLANLQFKEQPQLFGSQMANAAAERQLRNLQSQYQLGQIALGRLKMQEQPQLFNSQMQDAASNRKLRDMQSLYESGRAGLARLQLEEQPQLFGSEMADAIANRHSRELNDKYTRDRIELANLQTQEQPQLFSSQMKDALANRKLRDMQSGLAKLQLQEQPNLFDSQLQNAYSERESKDANTKYQLARLKKLDDYSPESSFGKLAQDYAYAKEHYGENSPQAKNISSYMNKLQQTNNGVNISQDDNGKPIIQIGGRGGSGAQTVYNQQTGQYGTVPTTAVATRIQNALVSDPQLMKTIDESVDLYSPYMGFKGQTKLKAERAASYYLGSKYPSLGTYDYLTKVQSPLNAEKLLRIAGINGAAENVKLMTDALAFDPTEGTAGMKQRILMTLKYLKQNQENNQSALSPGGIDLGENLSSSNNLSNMSLEDLKKLKDQLNGGSQ